MSWKLLKLLVHQQFSTRIETETLFRAVKTLTMSFYAVARGRTSGIFSSWSDCESQVKGFPGARYKKFNKVTDAQDFIDTVNGKKRGTSSVASSNGGSLSTQSSTSNAPHKRQFSTSNQNDSDESESDQSKTKKNSKKPRRISTDSDDSDGFSTIIAKQLDDIEERLKGFQKGFNKIIKKNGKTDKKEDFKTDHEGYVHVFTDGSCLYNGKKSAKAGLGVYWGKGHHLNISAPVSGRATNNCGEIQAATWAIKQAIDNGVNKLVINTDSQFLINSVTKWMNGWKRNGWKLQSGEPVKNEKDFKDLDKYQNKISVKWNYVAAHKGIEGNEMADELAKAGANMYSK